MDWVAVSLASAALFAIVSILDKVILTRYTPSAATFSVLTGVAQIPGALLVLLIVPFQSYSIDLWAAAYMSGFLWGASLVVMFWVMSREEVSRVIPVNGTSPIFVAVLAVIFLSEQLSPLQWIAIIVTVSGAALVSVRPSTGGGSPIIGGAFFFLIVSSLLVAGGQFLTKVAVDDMNVWNMYVLRTAGLSTAMVAFAFRPSVIEETRQVFANKRGVGLLALNEGGIAFVASIVTIWGISLGPVSLTVAVMSSRPFFVFIISVLASTAIWPLLNEPLDRGTLVQKSVSIAMITAGVTAISIL